MYEAYDGKGLELEPRTRERIREVFEGHTCCQCGVPAERLRAGLYYCGSDYLGSGRNNPVRVREYSYVVDSAIEQ
jgi:hypothetical protein